MVADGIMSDDMAPDAIVSAGMGADDVMDASGGGGAFDEAQPESAVEATSAANSASVASLRMEKLLGYDEAAG
jgi:hypothetical protein